MRQSPMPAPAQATSPATGNPPQPGQIDAATRCSLQLRALAARLEQANMAVRDLDVATVCMEVARELRSISGDRLSRRLYPADVQRKLDLPIRQCAILLIHLLATSGTVQTHATLARILSVKATRSDVVKVYIHNLRAALAKHSELVLIQTHYGRGYVIPTGHAALIRHLLD